MWRFSTFTGFLRGPIVVVRANSKGALGCGEGPIITLDANTTSSTSNIQISFPVHKDARRQINRICTFGVIVIGTGIIRRRIITRPMPIKVNQTKAFPRICRIKVGNDLQPIVRHGSRTVSHHDPLGGVQGA